MNSAIRTSAQSGLIVALGFILPFSGTSPANAQAISAPAAMSSIREREIKVDLFAMAGDSMRGREAGTLDELRASIWTANKLSSIGVKPFGEEATWYQWFNVRRTRISTISSSVSIGGHALTIWQDITPASNADGEVSAETIFLDNWRDTTVVIRGRVAVAMLEPTSVGTRTTVNTPEYRAVRQGLSVQGTALSRRGAAAVILIADSLGESAFDLVAAIQSRGSYTVIGGANRFAPPAPGAQAAPASVPAPRPVPVLLVHGSSSSALRVNGQAADIRIRTERFDTPSVNVIGVVRGTDPVLRDEYVVFSSHQDHDGVRAAVAGDSIWNGADDNASTSVALFAIARAWVKQPAKRSAIFIFHGAEERGLLGSLWHAAHPVVPLSKMVALLNGDMMGRNNPDSASLLGSQPPHRNSTALVKMAFDANARTGRFVLDSLWDRPTHPEGWYFRSDHVPYARLGVPALFFTTNLHPDYHTPRDEPSRIDYPKLTRMTRWMYLTGWIAANTRAKPEIDQGFRLER
ncbi:MAG: M28 family peptidase [Gemmatimonadaceae bacterium]